MLLLGLAFVLPTLALPPPTFDNGTIYAGHLKYNVCGPGAMPILYKEYHADMCPPAYEMNEAGVCVNPDGHYAGLGSGEGLCAPRYCEVRQTFRRYREVPIANGDCRWPMTCTFNVTNGGSFQMRPQVDQKWNEALNQGVTGGYSYASITISSDLIFTISPERGECGYLTFLPTVHESCGTMSQGRWRKDGFWPGKVECADYKSIGNMCTTQPYRSKDGKFVDGVFVFVKVDCANGKRLPINQQPPAYRSEVALPQSILHTAFGEIHTLPPDIMPPISVQRIALSDSDSGIKKNKKHHVPSDGISAEL